MKTRLKLYQKLSVAFLVSTAAVLADNTCTEYGPHTNAWQCLQPGTVSNSGALSYTSTNVCVDATFAPPVLVTNVTFSNGSKERLIWYDCSTQLNHWETNTVVYTNGSMYFVPSMPTSFTSPGIHTYAAMVNGVGTDNVCSISTTVAVVTVVVTTPWVSLPSGDLNYKVGQSPVLIDKAATVLSASGCSSITNVTVSLVANAQPEDVLAINNQGTGASQIGVTNNLIQYGGTNIGAFTGGSQLASLVITLTNASLTAVQALVQNITYHYYPTTNESLATRTVQFVLSDCAGNTNLPAQKNINLDCPSFLNVMLVMDCSGSMNDKLGGLLTKLAAGRNAAISFVGALRFTNDYVGLVTFSNFALLASPLTNNGSVTNIIARLSANGYTATSNGIALAQIQFPTNSAGTDALPVMVLLTDGVPTDSSGHSTPAAKTAAINAANAVKQAGIRLVTIGLGTNGNLNNFDPVLLTNMASTPDDCHCITNTASLLSLYAGIANSFCRQLVTNSLLTVSFVNPTNNELFVTSPLNISLDAVTVDLNGTVTNLQFFNGTNLLGDGALSSSNTWTLLWTDVGAGNYSVTVTAVDDAGNTATNSVSFTVNARPVVYITSPTNLQSFREITNITLSAVAYDPNVGGSITGVGFYAAETNLPLAITQNNVTNYSLTWSNLHAGVYPVTAVATNNNGVVSWSSIVIFRVTSTNLPPTVVITFPTNNAIFPNCPDITLTAVVTNGSGTVTNVEFFVNGQSIGSVADAPYSLNQCCWNPGTYTNVAVATDNLGVRCASTNVQIIISSGSPTKEGFWDPTFHTPGWDYGTTDECGDYMLALALCQSASLQGTDLYLAGLEYPGDISSPSLYKFDGTNWFRWGGGIYGLYDDCENPPFGSNNHAHTGYLDIGGVATSDSGVYVAGYDKNYDDDFDKYAVWQLNGTHWIQLGGYFQVGWYLENQFDLFAGSRLRLISQPKVQFIGADLYLFGNFDYIIGDTNIQYIAKWDAVSNVWRQVGTPLNAPVWALTSLKGNLVIGGQFTAAGGNTNANHIAELRGGNWVDVGGGVGGTDLYDDGYSPATNLDCEVFSLSVRDTQLFVGGDFTYAGNLTNVNSIAMWDGIQWKTLGGGLTSRPFSWYGFPYRAGSENFANAIIYTISPHCDTVYVGGAFSDAIDADGTDVPAASIAKATWNEGSQQWDWSDMDIGVYYQPQYVNLDGGDLLPASVLTTAIQEDQASGAYDVIVGGFTDDEFQSVGSAENFFPALSRWRVGYPLPPSLPNVTIISPISQTIITNDPASPTNVLITATASSSYTNIESVEFYVNGQLVDAEDDSSCSCGKVTNSYSWSTNQNGLDLLTAVAVDANNLTKASTSVLIDIKSPTNTIAAVDDQYSIPANGPAVTLNVLTNDIPATGLTINRVIQLHQNLGTASVGYGGKYITYVPNQNTYGTDIFYYSVTNASGAVDSASVTVIIHPLPAIEITEPGNTEQSGATNGVTSLVVSGDSYEYGGSITNVALYVNDVLFGQTNNPDFDFNWSTTNNGVYTFIAVAADQDGYTNASSPVTIITYGVTNEVTAAIYNLGVPATTFSGLPLSGYPVVSNGLFDLQGQAEATTSATNVPVAYQVVLCKPDGYDTPIADVTPQPDPGGLHEGGDVSGDLGILDFSGVPNGIYDLRLIVYGGGTQTNVTVRFALDSQLKIGQFSFSEQDFVLPVNGIPITITRTYNSQNPNSTDFGYSWSFAINSMDVQLDEQRQDVTIGTDQAPWADDGASDYGSPRTVSVRSGGDWDVTLTLPNGQQTTFAFSVTPGDTIATAQWKAPPWVHASLDPLVPGSDTVILYPWPYWAGTSQDGNNDVPIENQDFPGWILTTKPDNTQYYLRRGSATNIVYGADGSPVYARVYGPPKLTEIDEHSGDVIQINNNGISHYANGTNLTRSVYFNRDGQGRITAIYDPNGGTNGLPVVQYIYNQDTGNLIQVLKLMDRGAGIYATNKYHYDNPNFPHFITSTENGDGVPVARNYYDDSGRLTAVEDANGNRTQFTHNTSNNVDVVVDRLNHTNTYVYDLQGNVVAQTNALGQVATMSYDDNNNKTNEVVYLSNGQPYATNSYVYGGNNLLLSSTDPLGHTNAFTYNGYGQVMTSIDARGNSSTNAYDSYGNITTASDALGNTIVNNSYSDGLLTRSTDAVGTTAANSYDDNDNLAVAAVSDPSGAILSRNDSA